MVRCTACDEINTSPAEQCRRCGASIANVCVQCGAGNPGLARFCCGCGGRMAFVHPSDSDVTFPSSERRHMTVLFCDVANSTELSNRLDPEDWHRVLHQIHLRCGEIIGRNHGHVAQLLGDGVLSYFGYPVSAEDAPRQAVRAGLDLVKEVSAMPAPRGESLNVRVGIHTGPVIVGNVGSSRRRESLALGDTPNLAARIQETAPVGAVAISETTHRLVRDFFNCKVLGEFQLKGFPDPRPVHVVEGRRPYQTRLEAAEVLGLNPMVGRAVEVAALEKAWEATAGGDSCFLLLHGEAGIGKSRLVHALTHRDSHDGEVIELRCSEHAQHSAFGAFAEGLRRAAGIREDAGPRGIVKRLGAHLGPLGFAESRVALLANLLGAPLPANDAPQEGVRPATISALGDWITGSTGGRAKLVIAEDLHWADPSTLEVLKNVLDRGEVRTTCFVFTARPEFDARWSERTTVLSLTRLANDAARQLAAHVAGGKTVPREVLEAVVAKAEGIPLYVEEMTRSVIESGALRETDDGYEFVADSIGDAIPSTLRDSLMGRLDRLGQAKPLAQLAAVLGRTFSQSVLETMWKGVVGLEESNLSDALAHLVQAQLLTRDQSLEEPAFQFRHALLQQEAYHSLLGETRRDYHRVAAKLFVDQFPERASQHPEVVARHFQEAGELALAVDYWEKAGQRALAGAAYAEAITHFGNALGLHSRVEPEENKARRELDLRAALGVALITTHGFGTEQVETTYRRAAELCNELRDELPLRVLYGTWAVNLIRGDLNVTGRLVPNVEALVERRSDVESQLVLNAMLGAWAFFRGDHAEAAMRSSASARLCDTEAPREQYLGLLATHGYEGMLYGHLFWAWSEAFLGNVDSALHIYARAEALRERIDDPYVSACVYAFGAAMHHDLADLSVAGELARKTLELSKTKGFPHWIGIATIIMGRCLAGDGANREAVETIQRGLELLRTVGDGSIYVHYLSFLAEAHLIGGEPDQALTVLQTALSMTTTQITSFCIPELQRLQGEAWLARNDIEAAEAVLSSALELARTRQSRLHEGRIAKTLRKAFEATQQRRRGEARTEASGEVAKVASGSTSDGRVKSG